MNSKITIVYANLFLFIAWGTTLAITTGIREALIINNYYPITIENSYTSLLLFSMIFAAYGLLGNYFSLFIAGYGYLRRDTKYKKHYAVLTFSINIMFNTAIILATLNWDLAYHALMIITIETFLLLLSSCILTEHNKSIAYGTIMFFLAVDLGAIWGCLIGLNYFDELYWLMAYIVPTMFIVRYFQVRIINKFAGHIPDKSRKYCVTLYAINISYAIAIWPALLGWTLIVSPFLLISKLINRCETRIEVRDNVPNSPNRNGNMEFIDVSLRTP